jgi:hypothetical protein
MTGKRTIIDRRLMLQSVAALGFLTISAKAAAIAAKARFVAMAGSVRTGYGEAKPPEAECNVKTGPASWQMVFAAPWLSCAITPLDTCGFVVFDGDQYQALRQNRDPFARAIIANSEAWAPSAFWIPKFAGAFRKLQTPKPQVNARYLFGHRAKRHNEYRHLYCRG